MINNIPEVMQAAQIQADATVWAAICSTIAIIVGLFISYLTAKHIQRNTTIDELRRETYLNTVESYSRFMATLFLISADPKKISTDFLHKSENFSASIDKAMLVCSTNTKEKIVEFQEIFFQEYEPLKDRISGVLEASDDCDLAYGSHSSILAELEPIKVHLISLQVEDPAHEKIENALRLIDDKLKFANNYHVDALKKGELLKEKYRELNIGLGLFEKKVRPKALEVMYSFRQEIGIPTDKSLDRELNERINKLLS